MSKRKAPKQIGPLWHFKVESDPKLMPVQFREDGITLWYHEGGWTEMNKEEAVALANAILTHYTVTPTDSIGANPPSSTTFTTFVPGCPDCLGKGEVLFMIERPGGPPGNQVGPCPKCGPK